MTQKTILFLPIEVGLAHITRSLAVAEVLADKSHKVIFALPKRKHSLLILFSVDNYRRRVNKPK
jgi:hypothetical protein